MDKKYIISKLNEMSNKERLYIIGDTQLSHSDIIKEIESETKFGKKLSEAIRRVLAK